MRRRRFLSRREEKEAINKAFDYWAFMSVKPNAKEIAESMKTHLKPKIERTMRQGPTEHQEQAAVIKWWYLVHQKYQLPVFALFAIPNGGARDPITGSMLKAEGVRKGTPDLFLAAPRKAHHGLFIEMKVGDNKPSPEQEAFLAFLNPQYRAVVHWSSAAAIEEIEAYLAP